MKSKLGILLGVILRLFGLSSTAASAAPQTWDHVVDDMEILLIQAEENYRAGDEQGAKDRINEAYYQHYEVLGFEKATGIHIGGARVTSVEKHFSQMRRHIMGGESPDDLHAEIQDLLVLLREDAKALDPDPADSGSLGWTVFLQSLTIILREGFEALLVVSAVIAYLVKSGNKKHVKSVYLGVALAGLASAALAVLLQKILQGLEGVGQWQEIMEGVTALVAVAMLIYVSFWIFSKSDTAAWTKYIKSETEGGLARNSVFSMAFVAFLAVFREGAETIMFFQPILTHYPDDTMSVWLGIAAASVILLVAFLLFRFYSIKIPLRPFFLITSFLLAVMAFTFTGSGVRELIEGQVLLAHPLPDIVYVDILGIYPYVETVVAQIAVLLFMIFAFTLGYFKRKRTALEAAEEKASVDK